MAHLLQFLDWFSNISTAVVIIGVLSGIVCWWRGILPVLLRLGQGLAKRKIAIFAEVSNQDSLKSLLLDSKIFRKNNIISITQKSDIDRAEEATLYLVHWPSSKDLVDKILNKKNGGTGMIVYAPHDGGDIPRGTMVSLNDKRNVTITRFRGRLLSDILVSMMTTSWEK